MFKLSPEEQTPVRQMYKAINLVSIILGKSLKGLPAGQNISLCLLKVCLRCTIKSVCAT